MSEIDVLIHQKNRLQIMSLLYVSKGMGMLYIKQQTGLTWGNLASHVSKLEEGEYIRVSAERINNKNQTRLEITDRGRKAFEVYRSMMMDILQPED